jgi:hypothetical protein
MRRRGVEISGRKFFSSSEGEGKRAAQEEGLAGKKRRLFT